MAHSASTSATVAGRSTAGGTRRGWTRVDRSATPAPSGTPARARSAPVSGGEFPGAATASVVIAGPSRVSAHPAQSVPPGGHRTPASRSPPGSSRQRPDRAHADGRTGGGVPSAAGGRTPRARERRTRVDSGGATARRSASSAGGSPGRKRTPAAGLGPSRRRRPPGSVPGTGRSAPPRVRRPPAQHELSEERRSGRPFVRSSDLVLPSARSMSGEGARGPDRSRRA